MTASQVHHIEGLAARPDLAYTWSNLMSVCTRCHALLEREMRGEKS
jgi:predicted HNH restriction endonuclease